MAEYTPNVDLYKPNRNDDLEVDVTLAENFTKIDGEFKKTSEQLADNAYHYSIYGIKGDGVTDDTNSLKNAVLNIPKGSTLLLPDRKMKITSDIEVNRPIKIHGKKRPVYNFTTNQLESGTIIEGGMITITTGGDGTEIKDVGVINKNGDSFNVCFPVRDIVLDGVMCDASLHGVLIQSNRGLCADVHVKNSQAFNAVHGFVSKATRVTFENCTTFNCSLDGFVWVADNIPAASMVANLQDNIAVNCRAINSQLGFNAYARDMFSTNNANGIFFNGLKLIGCTAIGSTVAGFQIGEYNMTNLSITYVKPTNVIIDNCSEKGSATGAKSFRIKNSQTVIVSDTSIEKDYTVDYSDSVYIKLDNLNSLLSNYGNGDDIETFAVNSTAPSVKSGRTIFKTANTATTNIFNITEGKEDAPITILIDDDFTTIQNTQYMVLKNISGYTNKGSFVILKRDNGVWVELYGKQVPRGMVAKTITTSGAIDLNQSNLFAFTGGADATTTNKISVTGQLQPGELLTIIVRSSGGTLTFGGFDTMFSVPSGMPTSVTWNNALVTQWAYFPTTSKWVLVSKMENVPYT